MKILCKEHTMKKNKNVARLFLVSVPLIFLTATTEIVVFAAELRDYTLPSERQLRPYEMEVLRIPPSSPSPMKQVAPPTQQALPADVYERFRKQVQPLPPSERKKLKELFEKKVSATDNNEEKSHYYSLIAILYEYGIK